MKSFKQFINEADIHGNPAISPEYLSSLNQRAEATAKELEKKYGVGTASAFRAISIIQDLQKGKEKQLADLTKKVILEQYGKILGDTIIHIEIPTGNQKMKDELAKNKSQEAQTPTPMDIKDITDPTKINAIHKRKILNMITQGEAINSKKMLMGETNTEGLTELLGEDDAKKMIKLLIGITDIFSVRDWRIPEELGRAMIEMGTSGISKIDWVEKPKQYDPADDTEDDEDSGSSSEELVPQLTILGLDQAMLFHEAVKGIYGLINQGGLAHLDDETIKTVFMNTDTLADEIQDLKRAKLTAADLRDFINYFPEVESLENGRELVWGKMIDASIIPDSQFLELMNQIFTSAPLYRELGKNESPYSDKEISDANDSFPKAKRTVIRLLKLIKDELAEWEEQMRQWNQEQESDEDQPEYASPSRETSSDESDLSNQEILDLIDQALDSKDYAEAKRLHQFLK